MQNNKMQLSIRDVDRKVFKEFKAEAVREGLKVGRAITLAMQTWVNKSKGDRMSILDYRATHWGKGTEKTSEEIDKILYLD